jgi:hypothetical protein
VSVVTPTGGPAASKKVTQPSQALERPGALRAGQPSGLGQLSASAGCPVGLISQLKLLTDSEFSHTRCLASTLLKEHA